jgi:very-short-patch-repair endonuclease
MVEVAPQFRKQPTPSEAILWQALRGKQLDGRKFRRQQPIGPFVVDFFCPSERLIVEVDGPIHDQQRDADRQRQELLESLGLRFIRIAAADIETDLDATLATIRTALLPPGAADLPALPGDAAPATTRAAHLPPLPGVGEGGRGGEGTVHVTAFPREALKLVQLDGYVRKYGHAVPRSRFTGAPWSLEASDVDDLMAKIKRVGAPLVEFAGVKPYFGIKTGLNEAYLINTSTKEWLIREDPRSADVIRPFLRGQDMSRWEADWRHFWLIVLKSSGDYAWPWNTGGEDAESIFQQSFPALYQHFKQFEDRLRQRQDKGRYWWELRTCAYYDRFEQPKIFYPDITWRSQFSVDTQGRFSNNTVYFIPTASAWLLTVLNSPLI